jgi:hypothetical protein
MAKKDSFFLPDGPTDVSRQAITIGRIIDRLCQRPGEYQIRVTVPDHRRRPWVIDFYRVERLRAIKLPG